MQNKLIQTNTNTEQQMPSIYYRLNYTHKLPSNLQRTQVASFKTCVAEALLLFGFKQHTPLHSLLKPLVQSALRKHKFSSSCYKVCTLAFNSNKFFGFPCFDFLMLKLKFYFKEKYKDIIILIFSSRRLLENNLNLNAMIIHS